MDKVQGVKFANKEVIAAAVAYPFRPDGYGVRQAISRKTGISAKVVSRVISESHDLIMEGWARVNKPRDEVKVEGKPTGYYQLIDRLKAIGAESRGPREPDEHYLTPEMVEDQRRREKEMLGKAVETATKLRELTYTKA